MAPHDTDHGRSAHARSAGNTLFEEVKRQLAAAGYAAFAAEIRPDYPGCSTADEAVAAVWGGLGLRQKKPYDPVYMSLLVAMAAQGNTTARRELRIRGDIQKIVVSVDTGECRLTAFDGHQRIELPAALLISMSPADRARNQITLPDGRVLTDLRVDDLAPVSVPIVVAGLGDEVGGRRPPRPSPAVVRGAGHNPSNRYDKKIEEFLARECAAGVRVSRRGHPEGVITEDWVNFIYRCREYCGALDSPRASGFHRQQLTVRMRERFARMLPPR